MLDSQWFLVSAENQLRPLYYSTWYIFNFGQIFHLSETHPNVSRGSEEYSAKVSAKDLCIILDSQWFLVSAENQLRPLYMVYIYILVRFFISLKLTLMLVEVVRNTWLKVSVKDLALY